MEKET